MDVQVTGRHCKLSADFQEQVIERMQAVERLRDRVIRAEVMVSPTTRTKDPDDAVKVEITLHSKGPVVRAEGRNQDKQVAFDQAMERLKTQLRKAADRRKVSRGNHRPISVAEATAALNQLDLIEGLPEEPEVPTQNVAGLEVQGDGPLVVREKVFPATPLTLAQALDEMELVGHDFFLYVDAETRRPSVVYKRKAYSYGVIHLDVEDSLEATA